MDAGNHTHVLRQGNEDYVEEKHRDWSDVVLDDIPSVVFASHLVATFAPVVECQACAPNHGQGHDVVNLRSGQAIQVSPEVVVYIVDDREDTPQAVDLRVVAVEL
jgi:hypothetical protein